MSARRSNVTTADKDVQMLRADLAELKAQTRAADAADITSQRFNSHEFDKLSPTEQSAASLGVSDASWKPISFLNNKHYEQLMNANMLDDDLARRIEVRIKPRTFILYFTMITQLTLLFISHTGVPLGRVRQRVRRVITGTRLRYVVVFATTC